MPMPTRASPAVVLRSSNRRSVPSVGSTSSELARRRRHRLHGAAAERGGEQHVVDGHRAPSSLALVLPRREQPLRAGVRHHHAPLGVGQEDRIRDPVEDPLQEIPLVPESPLAFEARHPEPRAHEPVAEVLGHPRDLVAVHRHGAEQQEPRGRITLGRPRRGGARPGSGCGAARGDRRRASHDHGVGCGEGADQRVIARLQVDREAGRRGAGRPVADQVDEARLLRVDHQAVTFAHPAVLAQPPEGVVGDLRRVLAGEQELEEGEPALGRGAGGRAARTDAAPCATS